MTFSIKLCTFFKAEAQRRAAQQTEWNVLHKTWRHAKEVSIDCNIYRIQSSHSNQSCFPQRYDSAYAYTLLSVKNPVGI